LYVMMYSIVYRIVTLVSRYVVHHEKLYRCSPRKAQADYQTLYKLGGSRGGTRVTTACQC